MHGLFQSSGSFITSEERSLAFWLASRRQALPEGNGGYEYDVWLGNTRGVFGMGHRRLSRGDPRFWDWTIRELAIFDLPALVDEVRRLSGFDKVRPHLRARRRGPSSASGCVLTRAPASLAPPDRLHRPLARQRDGLCLALARYPARPRLKAQRLRRARAGRVCRPAHARLPVHGARPDGVEDVAARVWCAPLPSSTAPSLAKASVDADPDDSLLARAFPSRRARLHPDHDVRIRLRPAIRLRACLHLSSWPSLRARLTRV